MMLNRRSVSRFIGVLVLVVIVVTLLGSTKPALASDASSFCTTVGGTPGANLFPSDGTFGTLTGETLTNPPHLGPALGSGITSYTFSGTPNARVSGSPIVAPNNDPSSPEDGNYNITNSTYYRMDGAWFNTTDHGGTSSSNPSGNANGLMMMINASYDPGSFYNQGFDVSSNTNYEFSIWAMNMVPTTNTGANILPNVALAINRQGVDDNGNGIIDEPGDNQVIVLTGDITKTGSPTWNHYGGVLNTGDSAHLTIAFINNAPGGAGNDLAIDDLQFTSCASAPSGNISGRVYLDSNSNGSYDTGEPGIGPHVTVNLSGLDSSGQVSIIASSETAADGSYSFQGVPVGNYTVGPVLSDPDLTPNSPKIPATGTLAVSVTSGGNLTGQNFGFVSAPNLSIVKEHAGSLYAGQTGIFTLSVSNGVSAPSTSGTVTVTDKINLPLSYSAASGTGWTCSYASATTTVTCTRSDVLAAGGSYPVIALTVNNGGSAAIGSNTAAVSGGGDVSNYNNSSTDPYSVVSISGRTNVNLSLASITAAPTTPTPGATLSYTVTVSSSSSTQATDIQLINLLPAGFSATSYTPSIGHYVPSTGMWLGVNLTSSASVSLVITGTVSPTASGTLTITSIVDHDPASTTLYDGTLSNNTRSLSSTLGAPSADLAVTTTDGSTTAVPGTGISYAVTVTNNGPAVVRSLTLTDTSAPVLSSMTYTPSSGAYNSSTHAWTGLNLLPGEAVILTVTGTIAPAATGTIVNTAVVAPPSGTTDPTSGNNTATDTDTLVPTSDLSITKTDSVSNVNAGASTTYTIRVTNSGSGPSAMTGAILTDPAATGLTKTAIVCSGTPGVCTTPPTVIQIQSGTFAIPALAPGAFYEIVVTATVTQGQGSVSNVATIAAPSGAVDPAQGNNTATDTDTVNPVSDLAVTKTDGVSSVNALGSTTYTVRVTNNGPSAVTGSILSDPVATGLTKMLVLCSASTPGQCIFAPTISQLESGFALPALASGAFYEISVTTSVTVITGSVSNVATVAVPSGTLDLIPANNTATDTDSVTPVSDLAITKTDGQTNAVPGNAISYTITVTNAGPNGAGGAAVTDNLPATLTSATWTCSASSGAVCPAASGNGSISQTVATFPASGSLVYIISATVSQTATGSLANTASVAAPGGTTDPTPANNTATDTDTLVPTSDIAITKTDSTASVNAGGSTTYTIRVTNGGPSSVTGAILTDVAAAGLTKTTIVCSATPGQCTTPPTVTQLQSGTFALPALASGQYYEITVITNVTATQGSVSNVATVAAPSGTTDPVSGNNTATDTDTVTPVSDLSVTKTDGVASVNALGSTTYTIRVTNGGPSAVTGATLTDVAAAGLTKTSVACSGTPGQCVTAPTITQLQNGTALPALTSGQYYEITVAASVTVTSGSVSNIATIAPPSGTLDLTPANNTATDTDTVTPISDLSITKTDGVANVDAGSSTTYTIRVTNGGPSAVTGAVLTDVAAAGLTKTAVACSGTPGQCVTAPTVTQLQAGIALPALANGAFYEITVTANVTATTGSVSNVATIAAPGGTTDPALANNTATDTDTVHPVSDLAITKTDGVSSVNALGSTIYTVRVTNNGPSAVTGAILTDVAAAGLTKTAVACSGTPGVCVTAPTVIQLQSGTFALPALANGAFYEIRVTTTVTVTQGSVSNTATIAAPSGTADPVQGNNTDTDTDTVTPISDLSITKTDGVTSVDAFSSTTYTIRVTNGGPSAVTGAILTDVAAGGLTKTGVACSATPGQCLSAPTVSELESGAFALPALASGQYYEIAVTASVTATAGSVSNIATTAVPSGTTDPASGNNTATDTDTVNSTPDSHVPVQVTDTTTSYPWLKDTSIAAGTCSDGYFTYQNTDASCNLGQFSAILDFGVSDPITTYGATVTATLRGGAHDGTTYALTFGAVGSNTWRFTMPTLAGDDGAVTIDLSWKVTKGSFNGIPACTGAKPGCFGTFTGTQQTYGAGFTTTETLRSGKLIDPATGNAGYESMTEVNHQVVVQVGFLSYNQTAASVSEPLVVLRVSAGKNSAIDCDPALPNLRDQLTQGCAPVYRVDTNPTVNCDTTPNGAQPWPCVSLKPGAAVGQIVQGLTAKVLQGGVCSQHPNNWNLFPNIPFSDTRWANLFLTSFGALDSTSSKHLPVTGFAAFYITGWGGGCIGDDLVGAGWIVGHFAKIMSQPNIYGDATVSCDPTDRKALDPCVSVLDQ